MRQPIETAPRDGSIIILEDDASRTCRLARWSAKMGTWASAEGEPSSTAPSHWRPMPGQIYSQQVKMALRGLSSVPARSPMASVAGAARRLGAGTAPVQRKRKSRTRPFAVFAAACLLVASFAGTYFQYGITAALAQYPVGEEGRSAGADLRQAHILPSQPQPNVAIIRREMETQPTRQRNAGFLSEVAGAHAQTDSQEALSGKASEGAEQRQPVESTVLELRRSLQQEREKTAALERQAEAARQQKAASDEQHQRALDDERQRNAALLSELAGAQRGTETEAPPSPNVAGEAERQALEGTVAELRHSLQQEHEKAAALEQQAETARQQKVASEEQQQRALDEERQRSSVLLSELAAVYPQRDSQEPWSRKASEEAEQRQPLESTVTEL